MPAPSDPNAVEEAETIRLTFPPRPEHISIARLVAGALAERHGVAYDVVEEIRLLVSEACTNAVRAQLAREVSSPIVLDCVLNSEFRIEITDQAGGIAPEMVEHTLPDPEAVELLGEGAGFGIPLMRRLADYTRFTRNELGGTTVVLTLGREHMRHA